jgi:hypothetical protein
MDEVYEKLSDNKGPLGRAWERELTEQTGTEPTIEQASQSNVPLDTASMTVVNNDISNFAYQPSQKHDKMMGGGPQLWGR